MSYPYDGDATVGMIASADLPAAGDARRAEPIDAVFEKLLDSIANLKEGDPIFEGTPHFLEPPVFENGAWFKAGLFFFDTTSTILISTVNATISTTGKLLDFGEITVEDDAFFTVKNGGTARVQGGGVLNFNSDGACNFDDSSTLDLFSTSVMTVHPSASVFVDGTLATEFGSDFIIESGTNAELRAPLFHLGIGRDVYGREDTTPGSVSGIYTYGADTVDTVKVNSAPGTETIQIVLKVDANQEQGDRILITNVGNAGGGATINVYGNGHSASDMPPGIVIGSWTTDQKASLVARYNGTRWHAAIWTDDVVNLS